MFKAIKDDKIVFINETNNFPCVVVGKDVDEIIEDTEHQVSDYMQANGEFVLTSSDEAIEQKKAEVRAVRNQYLKQTDEFMIVDYPITSTQKTKYKRYRTYLRDYTLTENWFEHEPMSFDEWSTSQTNA